MRWRKARASGSVVLLLLAAGPAHAISESELKRYCDEGGIRANRNWLPSNMCFGYILGTLSGWMHAQDSGAPRIICLPPRIRNDAVVETITRHFRDRPGELQGERDAGNVVIRALSSAYPCQR